MQEESCSNSIGGTFSFGLETKGIQGGREAGKKEEEDRQNMNERIF